MSTPTLGQGILAIYQVIITVADRHDFDMVSEQEIREGCDFTVRPDVDDIGFILDRLEVLDWLDLVEETDDDTFYEVTSTGRSGLERLNVQLGAGNGGQARVPDLSPGASSELGDDRPQGGSGSPSGAPAADADLSSGCSPDRSRPLPPLPADLAHWRTGN